MRKDENIFIGSIIFMIVGIFILSMCSYVSDGESYSDNGISHKKRIGATYMTMNNSYFKIINEEIRNSAEEHGDELITRDPALSLQKQIDEIYEFIDLKVDAIFINPVDWVGVKSALEDAKKKGIIIIAIDTDVFDENLINNTVVSDNYEAGVECANQLMKDRRQANIILLEHATAKSAIDRIKGFENTVRKNSNYKIVARSNCNGQLETAMPVAEKLLKKNTNADVIMSLNDPSALGAITALEDMNLKNVSVYGIDGSPDGKKMVKNQRMAATVSQSPRKIGRIACNNLYDIFKGKNLKKKTVVPVKLINKDNIDDYKLDEWE